MAVQCLLLAHGGTVWLVLSRAILPTFHIISDLHLYGTCTEAVTESRPIMLSRLSVTQSSCRRYHG